MRRDADRQRLFTRRAAMLAGGQAVLIAALCGRLYYLQAVQAERFVMLAEENRINLRLIPPPRGRILDRRGKLLAGNTQDYRVLIVAEQSRNPEMTLASLGRLVPLDDADLRRVLKEIRWQRKFVPVTVAENLTWENVARIEVNTLDLPGISIEEGLSRSYPHGAALSHVVGYVAPVAPQDTKNDPLFQLPGFRIGKAGVEKVYELDLRGSGGRSQVEVNAVGRIIRELERKEGRAGADLVLSIDLDLQRRAYDRLGEESGAVVVMDVHTGEVLALVSKPGYDPDAFGRGLTIDEWRGLIADPRAPLTNKAVAGQYAPGSTFKVAVALAGLESGVITPRTVVGCSGRLRLGDALFHCWRRGGHGRLDLRSAIAQSCDSYFYEVARRTGVDAISAMAERLGLGRAAGIDLPAERPGLLPTLAWKFATFGTPWQKGETVITGIGQGYVLATPLQLAVMTARIANGGRAVVPRLLRGQKTPDGGVRNALPSFRALDIDRGHLQVVRDGMHMVVRQGTARGAAITIAGQEMAGKTGTSQVRRISRAERASRVRKNEDLPWHQRDHALFIGYAPVHSPRYAIAVVVEHGGGGAKVAAPIARDLLLAAQQRDPSDPEPAAPVPASAPERTAESPISPRGSARDAG